MTERGQAASSLQAADRQRKTRETLVTRKDQHAKNISQYSEERIKIQSNLKRIEAEVGPIKYIAALIYGDTVNDTLLESAVRIVILMIVFVFDPLAVLLLIAANREMMIHEESDKPDAWVADVGEKPTEEEKEEINYDPMTGISAVLEQPEPEPDDKHWEKIVADMQNWKVEEPQPEEPSVVDASVIPEPIVDKEKWIIPAPAPEVSEDFKKVVKEYFHKEDQSQAESMLYVNEEPEPIFDMNPNQDFNEKDPFQEKERPRNVIIPDSRTIFRDGHDT